MAAVTAKKIRTGNRVYCHTEAAVSSLAVAKTGFIRKLCVVFQTFPGKILIFQTFQGDFTSMYINEIH